MSFHVETFLPRPVAMKLPNKADLYAPKKPSGPLTLRPFQREGVDYMRQHGYRILLADEAGAGKGVQICAAIDEDRKKLTPAVVVCPTSVLTHWKREARKWIRGSQVSVVTGQAWRPPKRTPDVIVISWDLLAHHEERLRALNPKLLTLDECFPAGTPVATPTGSALIEDIRPGDVVLACDVQTGRVRPRTVTRLVAKSTRQELWLIVTTDGRFTCTPDHKVWTVEEGYVPAQRLTGRHHLRTVRHAGDPTLVEPGAAKVLLSVLLRDVAQQPAVGASSGARERQEGRAVEQGAEATGRCPPDAREQPHEGCSDAPAGFCNASVDGARASSPKRERPLAVGAAAGARGCDRLADRGSCGHQPPGRAAVRSAPVAVLDRPGRRGDEDCGGDRWSEPCKPGRACPGRAEDAHPDGPGLASAALHEPAGGLGRGSVRETSARRNSAQVVYDLEVEVDHNYFVDGHLVSNCHYAKNPETQRGQAASRLSHQLPHVLLLSGTPLVNTVDELLVLRRMLGSTSPPMLRRLLADVAPDVPPKTRVRVEVPISAVARREYQRIEKEFDAYLEDFLRAQQNSVDEVEARKKRALSAAALVKVGYLRRLLGRAKAPAAAAFCAKLLQAGEPVVIFAEHMDVLDAVGEALDKVKVTHTRIDGSTPRKARQKAIDDFQAGKVSVVLCTQAAKEGITLTRARNVCFIERWWTPAAEEQGENRCARIGQRYPTKVWFLLVPDSFDVRSSEIVEAKRALVRQHVGQQPVETVDGSELLRGWLKGQALDDFTMPAFPSLPTRFATHEIRFAAKNWQPDDAVRWAGMNGFPVDDVHQAGGHVRLRIRPAAGFQPGSFRRVKLGPDIEAIVGKPKRVRAVTNGRRRTKTVRLTGRARTPTGPPVDWLW